MNFDEDRIMKEWDLWRNKIANGNKSSSPRDWFENLLDQWKEDVENAFKCNSQIKEKAGEQRPTKDSAPCSMCGEPVLLADIHCGRCKSKNISYWFADEQYECLNCNFIWKK